MTVVSTIDPVTRIEGHLKIDVTIDVVNGVQQVVDARATGTLFRGFEKILIDRDPWDARHVTERICGVCPVAHGMTAVMALEKAYKLTIPENARVMRNLVLGSNFIQSHILHFFHLSLPDFVNGPNMPPWQPSWNLDKRFNSKTAKTLVDHYVTALDMRRKAHEMAAIFGGRLPNPPAYVPGGFTTTPRPERIAQFKVYLNELLQFINNTYLPDVETVASAYRDYSSIGKGYGNLLAYGAFNLDSTGSTKLFQRGMVTSGAKSVQPVDETAIMEHIAYSWYADSEQARNPASGVTEGSYPKEGAYSWLKAPRYLDLPYEVGPLARMWINGDYQKGISVMDRHRARAREALKIATAMQAWIEHVHPGQPVYSGDGGSHEHTETATTDTTDTTDHSEHTGTDVTTTLKACGMTEAARGALGHWIEITNDKISHYQVITPTCWNASPRDNNAVLGPMEKALIGTPVKDVNKPIEVLRVIHSYDPCLSCAVHVMRPAEKAKIFTIGHYHGEEEIYTHDHGDGHVHTHTKDAPAE